MITKEETKILLAKIKQYDQIIIAKHKSIDWDAQGSAFGLAYLIQENLPKKKIYIPGERINDNPDFLPDKEFNSDFISQSLLIVVDTANTERIDFADYLSAKEIIKLDHHLAAEDYGTICIVDESAVACAQIIIQWAKAINWHLNAQIGENLYKGLMTDSGRLLFSKVNAESYQSAALVRESGFDFEKVNEELYVSSLKDRQWLNYAFTKVQSTTQGVAYIILEPKDYNPWNLEYWQIKSALNTMAGIAEFKIWILILVFNNEIKVSLRARQHDVNSVAEKWGGGGHKLAAGAKLKNLNDYHKLIEQLNQLIKK